MSTKRTELDNDTLESVNGGSVKVEANGNVYRKVNGVPTGEVFHTNHPDWASEWMFQHYYDYPNEDALIQGMLAAEQAAF